MANSINTDSSLSLSFISKSNSFQRTESSYQKKQTLETFKFHFWQRETSKTEHTGIPCFIGLHFIMLHRCCFFSELKASPHQQDYKLLYCDTCFTGVVWNRTHKISEVCLYCQKPDSLQEEWGQTTGITRCLEGLAGLYRTHMGEYTEILFWCWFIIDPFTSIKWEMLENRRGWHYNITTGKGKTKMINQ